MKKILIVLFIVGISLPVLSNITNKQVAGVWKYKVETDQGAMTGKFDFAVQDGKLSGKVITDDGDTIPFTKIEIKEDNTLYLELETDSDSIKITVKITDNKFTGTGVSLNGEAPITGEKIPEP